MLIYDAIPGVDMAEKMQMWMDTYNLGQKMLITVVDIIIEVEDSVCRRMSNQDIGIGRYAVYVAFLTVGDTVAHKHRYTIKFHSVNLNAGITEIMHVGVKSADIGSIHAIVVVAAYEYLVGIGQVAQPVHKVDSLCFQANHTEVAGMHQDICCGQVP